jgi:hypothetical protein
MKRSVMLCASVVVALLLTANCASAKSINYNASKSNTENVTVHNTGIGTGPAGGFGQPGMAVKGSGVPQNGTTVTGGGGGVDRMGGGGGGRTK